MLLENGSTLAVLTVLYAFFLGVVMGQVLPQLPHLLVPWSKFLRRRSSSKTPEKIVEAPNLQSHNLHDAQLLDSAQDLAPQTPTPVDSNPSSNRPWYVTRDDLRLFQRHAEEDEVIPGASEWQPLLQKDTPGLMLYTSHRRTLPNGQTEYRNVTVAPDATAEEFMDFSLDDECRCRWENFMVSAEILEQGDYSTRQQVVRWVRTFNMSFLSDREYVLGRILFRMKADGTIVPAGKHTPGPDESLYCLTKAIHHPAAEPTNQLVQIEEMYSMFRCRTVPCPWGTGRPATECVLLHMENMKVPERLAKVAVRFGMLGYVTKMSSALQEFVRERRTRVDPFGIDPEAFGSPLRRGSSMGSSTVQSGDLSSTITAVTDKSTMQLSPTLPSTPPGASTPPRMAAGGSADNNNNAASNIAKAGQALWRLLPRRLTNSSGGSEEEVLGPGKSTTDMASFAQDGQRSGLANISVSRTANGGNNIFASDPAAQPRRTLARAQSVSGRKKAVSGLAANRKPSGLSRNLRYLGAAIMVVTVASLVGKGSRRQQRQAEEARQHEAADE